VKHSDSGPPRDPSAIGAAVAEILEAFLASTEVAVEAECVARIETFAACIALWGSRMNLTAHPEDPEEIAFHVIDSVMPIVIAHQPNGGPLAGAFDSGRKILDLGSGAGFPGLVLAAASLANLTLVESRRKRASFLQVAVAEMNLRNVHVEAARAETSHHSGEFDLVTARAFGDAAEFFELASAALKPGGLAMIYANPSQRLNLDSARENHLIDYNRIAYSVARHSKKVDRVLAMWKRANS
jgi:16S rRNA (guanine527-N7)-methyltransferase